MRWPETCLEDAEDLFALAEAVEEDGERADVHGVGAEPDQVRLEAGQLVEQHTQVLRAFGDLQPQQLLDRQAVGEVVGHRAEVVDAVGQRHDLLVELGLAGLLDAGVQIADVGHERDDGFAIDLEHQAKHAVRRRMLRAHVEDHGLVLRRGRCRDGELRVGDDVFDAGNDHGLEQRSGAISGSPPPDSPCAADGLPTLSGIMMRRRLGWPPKRTPKRSKTSRS